MDIHIDPHLIASVVGFVAIFVLCCAWARFFLRLDTFLGLLGLALTVMVMVRGDLSLTVMEGTGLLGAALTAVIVGTFLVVRYSWRKNRLLSRSLGRTRRGNQALRFVERDEEPVVARRGRLQERDNYYERRTVPTPALEEREVPLDTDEVYEEEEVYTRAPQRHSAQSRSRGGYVVKSHPAGKPSSARGAGLQQQRQQQRRRA